MSTFVKNQKQLTPGSVDHLRMMGEIRDVQKRFPKKGSDMNDAFFNGFEGELFKKQAGPLQQAAPAAEGLAGKIVGALRKKPLMTAGAAAAAGAGAAKGVQVVKEKKQEEEARREQVRQLLMSRLSEGGGY